MKSYLRVVCDTEFVENNKNKNQVILKSYFVPLITVAYKFSKKKSTQKKNQSVWAVFGYHTRKKLILEELPNNSKTEDMRKTR